ncbi:hypothetical protein M406DRAFT_69348 [Cryphonectria parasitica EP155]|uniref:Uncharacterized protein n=1 Tax=Cryphonectria parasitica (strain ATCC 38755 / EP155) TaxID=660469 RepID=A0A9P4Y675_CRYP1|nr:uncharacterized protein M406DRAFT_69348 [Cryphonectria parasitica EP155]KAF3767189.1 hypothetical protein M406DRAFT_69348 [Cryphonectria parasitica EP155]
MAMDKARMEGREKVNLEKRKDNIFEEDTVPFLLLSSSLLVFKTVKLEKAFISSRHGPPHVVSVYMPYPRIGKVEEAEYGLRKAAELDIKSVEFSPPLAHCFQAPMPAHDISHRLTRAYKRIHDASDAVNVGRRLSSQQRKRQRPWKHKALRVISAFGCKRL